MKSTLGCMLRYCQKMATIQGNDRDALADKEQLAAVRIAVDEVDEQIVTLIARRERLIRIAGTLKGDDAEVRAPGRVERVIEHVRAAAEKKDIDPDIVESTYRAMISGFIELEMKVHKETAELHGQRQSASSTATPPTGIPGRQPR